MLNIDYFRGRTRKVTQPAIRSHALGQHAPTSGRSPGVAFVARVRKFIDSAIVNFAITSAHTPFLLFLLLRWHTWLFDHFVFYIQDPIHILLRYFWSSFCPCLYVREI